MQYCIENDVLCVEIDDIGAQLWSIKEKSSMQEYLWQGDNAYWSDRAINLFPVCGRLWENKYTYQDKTYSMGIHGFLPNSLTTVVEHKADSITFRLTENDKILEQYPFLFILDIIYQLNNNTLNVSYKVHNKGENTLPYSIGGHPGFNVPFEGGSFDDYVLEFSEVAPVKAIAMSSDCFLTQQYVMLPLENGKTMHLSHMLFDNDALVLRDCARGVSLKRKGGSKSITLQYKDMPYLGVWHWPRSDAPYICIEPWSALPSYHGIVDDFATKESFIQLKPHDTKVIEFSISID